MEYLMTLDDKIKTGEPLMQQAMDAMRRYHEARDSLTAAEEVERLRLEAEALMQAVSEYQQAALGGPAATRH
jgi:transcriptional antiterminator Rof (Rho-off)